MNNMLILPPSVTPSQHSYVLATELHTTEIQVHKEETVDKTYYVAITFLGFVAQVAKWCVSVGKDEEAILSKRYQGSRSFSFKVIEDVVQITEEDDNASCVKYIDISHSTPKEVHLIIPASIKSLLSAAKGLFPKRSFEILYNESIVVVAPIIEIDADPSFIDVFVGNTDTNEFTTISAQYVPVGRLGHFSLTVGSKNHVLTLLPTFGDALSTEADITWDGNRLYIHN